MQKKWQVNGEFGGDIVSVLLANRGIQAEEREVFLHPKHPDELTSDDVDIDASMLQQAIVRIRRAIDTHESIVVYADYDADGVSAGAIMWETLHKLGASVMPYIPHRASEGYGFSRQGIDFVLQEFKPTLIISVDHGISAWEKIAYAKAKGIDVIVTDHHTKPDRLPDTIIVHTTKLCGAGVAWFLANQLDAKDRRELLPLAAIGTIADLVPLVGPNRSIVKYGLAAMSTTSRIGLKALMDEAGIDPSRLVPYQVSHMIAPRINAMGRLEHAMDALRLLCTTNFEKSQQLVQKLALTNKERQTITADMFAHANALVTEKSQSEYPGLLFVSHESYNPGVIGLVAGKLVETYWKPAVVLAVDGDIAKASARSIPGFNIIEAIRTCADILVDMGGHPMAAGFTVETKNINELAQRLAVLARDTLTQEQLTRTLSVDMEIPMEAIRESVWQQVQSLQPFGFGNPEPLFVTRGVRVLDVRTVGMEGKHLKLRLPMDAIAFGFGHLAAELTTETQIDIAYAIDMNEWNGRRTLQLKVKDIHLI